MAHQNKVNYDRGLQDTLTCQTVVNCMGITAISICTIHDWGIRHIMFLLIKMVMSLMYLLHQEQKAGTIPLETTTRTKQLTK
ncbi:hypothetical protein AN694_0226000 [Serratia marcescens]|uniref:Uncharacterized protein n=1 Tax=Serratia marcescens TaxID=615 RepID=A0A2F0P2S2_SERMA|nr:hypothetical protein AN694_0226000 [Serratia marcescens]OCO78362.1 hypothetical protein AN695_0226915 [Serratia marcescens]